MKFQVLPTIIFTLLTSFFSFQTQAKNHQINKSNRSDIAIKGYDSVAYFTENKAIKGNKNITYFWNDAKWLFNTTKNRTLFIEHPEKYTPQYGGWCAYAMSDGRFVKIDPQAFEIVDEKLYLNYSQSVLKHWQKEKYLFIKQANTFYQKRVALPVTNKAN